jgi:thymidylate synthase
MNNADTEYFKLIDLVLSNGKLKHNRTGIDTIGVFGAQARFNLQEGFPLLTTKKVFFRGVAHELLWFLSGSTNIKYLVDNDVHIWDDWAFSRYQKEKPKLGGLMIFDELLLTNQEKVLKQTKEKQSLFIQKIKNDPKFAAQWGELGEGTYGSMWRKFPFYTMDDEFKGGKGITGEGAESWVFGEVDQIKKLVDTLKTNPNSRRLIVSAWHPYLVEHCELPPCHCLFQFHTEELTIQERALLGINSKTFTPEELKLQTKATWVEDPLLIPFLDKMNVPKRRLNCHFNMRSSDIFLGLPLNIASYALLTHMVAQSVNMVAGELLYSVTDLHLYVNHIEQAKLQRVRKPFENLPTLKLNSNIKNLLDFKYEDITIENYQCHPSIKADVAV